MTPGRGIQDAKLNILLIEDNPGDARLIREMLSEVKTTTVNLEYAETLQAGLERLGEGGIDVVLLDLSLPDSEGFETFLKVQEETQELPIIVLTGLDDETLAVKAVQKGAQDYLVKGKIEGSLLVRAARYAIERQRMMDVMRTLSLVDELTDLYNRRGFLTIAEHHLKLSRRTKKGLLVFYADVDNFKRINNTLGHHQGDLVLIEIANVLKETFREADLISRIGGDEFVVLAMEVQKDSTEILLDRLQDKLKSRNAEGKRCCKLSMSVGVAYYDPERPRSIDELLQQADELMYEHKRSKQKSQVI